MTATAEHPAPLATRRRVLEQKREQYLTIGYDAEAEAEGLSAQTAASPKEKREQSEGVTNLRLKAESCYASAKRMREMLDELPDEKAEQEPG